MAPIAQMVSPNTWRIVGDRGDVDEAYIPMDGSARSLAILAEVLRRMPGAARLMSDGGVLERAASSRAEGLTIPIIIQGHPCLLYTSRCV